MENNSNEFKIFELSKKDIHEARTTKWAWISYIVASLSYATFFVNLFFTEWILFKLLLNEKASSITQSEIVFLGTMQVIFFFTRQKAGAFLFGLSKSDTKSLNDFVKNAGNALTNKFKK